MDEKLQILLVPNNKTKEEFTTNKNTQWQPWRKNTVSSIIMREPKKEKKLETTVVKENIEIPRVEGCLRRQRDLENENKTVIVLKFIFEL